MGKDLKHIFTDGTTSQPAPQPLSRSISAPVQERQHPSEAREIKPAKIVVDVV